MPTEQERRAKERALANVADDLAVLIAPTEFDSADIQFEDVASSVLTSYGTGLAAAEAATAFISAGVATGGIGLVVGAAALGLSLIQADKKREAAERKWKQALSQYKEQLDAKDIELKGKATQIEKKAKGDSLQSIFKETEKAVTNISRQIDIGATGVRNITQEERIDDLEDQAGELVFSTYDKLLKKVDIIDEARELLTLEKEANREFGQVQAGYTDDIQRKLGELQDV